MNFKLKYLVSFIFFCVISVQASELEALKKFEQVFYKAAHHGLNDVVFDAEILGLTRLLNQKKIYGDLKKVYFKVFWNRGRGYVIEVQGMPKGFLSAKDELRALMERQLIFIFPKSISKRFQGYQFKRFQKAVVSKVYSGHHPNYVDNITSATLHFGKHSLLRKMEIKKPNYVEMAKLFFEKKGWSKGKFVLVGHNLVATTPTQTIESEIKISYSEFFNIGLPIKITTNTVQKGKITAGDLKASEYIQKKVNSDIIFSNYIINSDKGLKYIRSQNI